MSRLIMNPFNFVSLLYVFLIANLAHASEDIPRVGIIGAGVGGTSAAYFLRELFGDNVEIDIFEKERVGGRLAPVTISGQNYDAGGTLVHPDNLYMVNFTEMLGLERRVADTGRFGVFNGNEMLFESSGYKAFSIAKLLWRYGMDAYNINGWVRNKLLNYFLRLYDLQREGHAFSTVEDLLQAAHPSLVTFTKQSIQAVLKQDGFSDRFIDELVAGALRNNYGQTTDVQGFVGAVSMAGVEPGLWSVAGGNHQVPQGLLKKSKANLIRAEVRSVALDNEGASPVYQLDYMPAKSKNDDDLNSKEYDIVIFATPVYRGMSTIQFLDFQNDINPVEQDFHTTVATFIEGQPNATYFGCTSNDSIPTEIFTTKDVFFSSFGKLKTVSGESTKKPVYRIFSNSVPNVGQLKQLVADWTDLRVVDWRAYPDYPSSVELPSFTLHEQMYHINAIEAAASAMEMSVIGAKNVALLAYYRYTGQYDKIDEVLSESGSAEKTEL